MTYKTNRTFRFYKNTLEHILAEGKNVVIKQMENHLPSLREWLKQPLRGWLGKATPELQRRGRGSRAQTSKISNIINILTISNRTLASRAPAGEIYAREHIMIGYR